ncbi:hypothetical protein M422DRAFT_245329 [Sphaerobolus stellatus SS14]|nr:hypothetical protein M422DRAFT_245329 [Sphaerobolus stellatus SS14]
MKFSQPPSLAPLPYPSSYGMRPYQAQRSYYPTAPFPEPRSTDRLPSLSVDTYLPRASPSYQYPTTNTREAAEDLANHDSAALADCHGGPPPDDLYAPLSPLIILPPIHTHRTSSPPRGMPSSAYPTYCPQSPLRFKDPNTSSSGLWQEARGLPSQPPSLAPLSYPLPYDMRPYQVQSSYHPTAPFPEPKCTGQLPSLSIDTYLPRASPCYQYPTINTHEPVEDLANHNSVALANWHDGGLSRFIEYFSSKPTEMHVGNTLPQETMQPYTLSGIESHNLSQSSVQLTNAGIGDANHNGDLSNLSTTFMSPKSNTTQSPNMSHAGPSSYTAAVPVDNLETRDAPTPLSQKHIILPPTQPEKKNPEVYIETFSTEEGTPFFKCLWKRCKGPTFWERAKIHEHVKAHIMKKTHECLCGSTFSNFQAAQKHCRNKRSAGNICPTW